MTAAGISLFAAGRAWCRRRAVAVLLAGLALACAGGLRAEPASARFRPPAPHTVPELGAQVLTAEERAYLDKLPEIRVAVPRPPARPYETLSADGEVGGIHPDMLVYLGRAFGLRLRPVLMPDWSSTLAAARRRPVHVNSSPIAARRSRRKARSSFRKFMRVRAWKVPRSARARAVL